MVWFHCVLRQGSLVSQAGLGTHYVADDTEFPVPPSSPPIVGIRLQQPLPFGLVLPLYETFLWWNSNGL